MKKGPTSRNQSELENRWKINGGMIVEGIREINDLAANHELRTDHFVGEAQSKQHDGDYSQIFEAQSYFVKCWKIGVNEWIVTWNHVERQSCRIAVNVV